MLGAYFEKACLQGTATKSSYVSRLCVVFLRFFCSLNVLDVCDLLAAEIGRKIVAKERGERTITKCLGVATRAVGANTTSFG